MRAKLQKSLFDLKPRRGPKNKIPYGEFGGKHHRNYNPSSKRPMDSKKALHVVLKSSVAIGVRSFKNKAFEESIWKIIEHHAKKNGVKVYGYANAGNHLHLLLRAKHREDYNKFIRVITGLIARLVGQSERGQPLKKKFWDARPFTRIVSFAAKEYRTIKNYLLRNTLEAIGWVPYFPRNKRLPLEYKRLFVPAMV